MFSSMNNENVSRTEKIHRMHLLKMRLTYFVNSLHNYIMTRVSWGLCKVTGLIELRFYSPVNPLGSCLASQFT